MSNHPMNYLPFDYNKYTRELLPMLRQATEGEVAPLEGLIRSTPHISLWIPWEFIHEPVPLSPERVESFMAHWRDTFFDQLVLDEGTLDPRPTLLKAVQGLVGKDFIQSDDLAYSLHVCLLFTFCCNAPSSKKEHVELLDGPAFPAIFDHEEQTFDWQDYITGDAEIAPLWSMFHHSAPLPLTRQFTTSDPSPVSLGPDCPRKLDVFGPNRPTISGFITPEEAQSLLTHVQTHRQPSITPAVIRDCVDEVKLSGYEWRSEVQPPKAPVFNPVYTTREEYCQASTAYTAACQEYLRDEERYYQTTYEQWIREHPTEMTDIVQARLHVRSTSLWHREDQIMEYLRYAVTCGWGMLEIYD